MSGKMNPSGLCMCGCGKETTKAPKKQEGYKKGDSKKYIKYHGTKGADSPNWKGGRGKHSSGYITIRVAPRKYVMEHVLIAEKALGKSLPEGALIHHVNEDRADNRPENLVICESWAYHRSLHRRMEALKATGNPESKRCRVCHEWGVDLKVWGGGGVGHEACAKKYWKKVNALR